MYKINLQVKYIIDNFSKDWRAGTVSGSKTLFLWCHEVTVNSSYATKSV